jgi:hypothetical protein
VKRLQLLHLQEKRAVPLLLQEKTHLLLLLLLRGKRNLLLLLLLWEKRNALLQLLQEKANPLMLLREKTVKCVVWK